MPRSALPLLSVSLLCLAACQTRYQDVSGLNRGQTEFNIVSAKCQMYARQIANQTMGNAAIGSLVMGGNYLAGAQFGASIAMTANYNNCMQASGFMPMRQ